MILMVHLPGEDLFVDYLDGELDVMKGGSWTPLYIGDSIDEDVSIKLYSDSYVELTLEDVKLTLEREGVYEVSSLLGQIVKADRWGIKSSSLAKLFRDDVVESRQSVVMGVRGDLQDEETMTWVDDDREFLESGKNFYMKGDFEKAILLLEEGAEWYGANYDEILFYKALSEYETGQYRQMRESVLAMDPYPDVDFFGDYVLLKGNLLIESRDYSEAEDLFDNYIRESTQREDEQEVYLLWAFCSLESDKKAQSREKLEKVVSINPRNEMGRKASEILDNL